MAILHHLLLPHGRDIRKLFSHRHLLRSATAIVSFVRDEVGNPLKRIMPDLAAVSARSRQTREFRVQDTMRPEYREQSISNHGGSGEFHTASVHHIEALYVVHEQRLYQRTRTHPCTLVPGTAAARSLFPALPLSKTSHADRPPCTLVQRPAQP